MTASNRQSSFLRISLKSVRLHPVSDAAPRRGGPKEPPWRVLLTQCGLTPAVGAQQQTGRVATDLSSGLAYARLPPSVVSGSRACPPPHQSPTASSVCATSTSSAHAPCAIESALQRRAFRARSAPGCQSSE